MIDGVTTNPTLIMKSGKCPTDVYQAIKDIGIKDISMEVVGDYNEMQQEGQRLYNRFGNVATIKVPCTEDGLMKLFLPGQRGYQSECHSDLLGIQGDLKS